MPRFILKKQTPGVDINPMVDMAFQLIIFFMLTTQFKIEEPVTVETPSSQTEIKLPESNIMTITVAKDGKIFFTMDGKFSRDRLLNKVGEKHNIKFSDEELKKFALMSSFGIPVQNMKMWLSLENVDRKDFMHPGIPCDTLRNELADWVVLARIINPKIRIAIKGDRKASYATIQRVMKTLIDNHITRFNLVTDLES